MASRFLIQVHQAGAQAISMYDAPEKYHEIAPRGTPTMGDHEENAIQSQGKDSPQGNTGRNRYKRKDYHWKA